MSINSVVLCGRLTKDAERKQFTNSVKFSFSIAVEKKVKKGDQWDKVTNYFDIEAWNIDYIKDALTKGRQVLVSGELDTSEYTNKDNQKVKRVFVRVDKIQVFHFASEKKEEPKKEVKSDIPYDPEWDDMP